MANRDLLKEAIADAKAVKEAAIANAKAALEETFTPYLKEKLAAKLTEMEEEEEVMDTEEVTEMKDEEIEETYDTTEEGMDAEEDVDVEMDLDELLRELDELDEEDETMDERLGTINDPVGDSEHGNLAEAEEEEAEEEGEEEETEEEDEEIDLENMDEEDLKKFIEDVIADMVEAGELEAGEGMEGEEEEETEEEGEEEIVKESMKKSLKEFVDPVTATAIAVGLLGAIGGAGWLKASKEEKQEIAKLTAKYIDGGMDAEEAAKKATDFVKNQSGYGSGTKSSGSAGSAFTEGKEEVNEIMGSWEDAAQMLGTTIQGAKMFSVALGASLPILLGIIGYFGQNAIEWAKKTYNKLTGKELPQSESGEMNEEEEVNEEEETMEALKAELNEVNLLNAKLLYSNKIFKSFTLTESQKVKVLATFDKATSVKEAKLVYETLNSNYSKSKKKPMNESLVRGSASKPTGASAKKPIMEANDQVARWQKLAGIIK